MGHGRTGRLLVDGGQTGTRLRLLRDGCAPLDRLMGPLHTDRPVVEQVAGCVRGFLQDVGAGGRKDPAPVEISSIEVAAGVSGLTPEASSPEELLAGLAGTGVRRVALTHDSVSAYLGANSLHRGAVTAVGTGVVTLGVGSRVARVDGWGHLVGDAGSGYWIGRAGIDAALRDFDGRGIPTSLRTSAEETFGPLPEVYMSLQGDPDRVARIAGFARVVGAAAEAGDKVADAITVGAADELARSLQAALVGSAPEPDSEIRVSWTGAVLGHHPRIRDHLAVAFAARVPATTVTPPIGEPMDGVALLLDLSEDHPLADRIHRASAD